MFADALWPVDVRKGAEQVTVLSVAAGWLVKFTFKNMH